LTPFGKIKFHPRHVKRILLMATVALAAGSLSAGAETIPFSTAKVSRIENDVAIGDQGATSKQPHPAKVDDTVSANDYVVTQTDSRAELKFPDTSLVRIGQNTVFTFDAKTRTLDLKRGSMLFYVKPHTGGGIIKTPTLTAAITGTICKVSENMIAVLKGQLTTKWGIVPEGYAIEWVDGEVHIFKFDPAEATTGKLYSFGGPLPESIDLPGDIQQLPPPDLHEYDIKEITQVNPRVDQGLKDAEKTPTPPPSSTVTPTPTPIITPPPTPRHTPTPTPTDIPRDHIQFRTGKIF